MRRLRGRPRLPTVQEQYRLALPGDDVFFKQRVDLRVMKKKAVWMAAAVAGLTAGSAFAQASVTLYGVADVGVEYANHLGGGLRAVFALESGFSVDDGKSTQSSRLFGRQAWIGLSNAYGTLTAGPSYDCDV